MKRLAEKQIAKNTSRTFCQNTYLKRVELLKGQSQEVLRFLDALKLQDHTLLHPDRDLVGLKQVQVLDSWTMR